MLHAQALLIDFGPLEARCACERKDSSAKC